MRSLDELESGQRNGPVFEISKQHEFVRNILGRVTVGQTTITLEINKAKFVASLMGHGTDISSALVPPKAAALKLTGDFRAFRPRGEVRIVSPHADGYFEGAPVMSLVKVAARAHDWYQRIVAGKISTVAQLAQRVGLTKRYVRRVLQCANLSPHIVENLLTGKHPPNSTVKAIVGALPLDWREQDGTFFGQDGLAIVSKPTDAPLSFCDVLS